jgi:hypothetical protein
VQNQRRAVWRAVAHNDDRFKELMEKTNPARKDYDTRNLHWCVTRHCAVDLTRLAVRSFNLEHDRIDSRHIDSWPTHRRGADDRARVSYTNWRKRDRDVDLLRVRSCRYAESEVESSVRVTGDVDAGLDDLVIAQFVYLDLRNEQALDNNDTAPSQE